MAATFRFPKPRKREDPLASIPQFYWQDLTDLRRIGNGSFGCVDFANYRPKGSTHASPQAVVVKQLSSADAGYEKEFAKEAKLLYSVKGHPNIVEFLAVCAKPTYALMQKYEAFSFVPFSDETVVNSLATFLSHVESMFEFTGFERVQEYAVKDIVTGLSFLHSKGIVHRDLKPANILVSNQHYIDQPIEMVLRQWQDGQIVPLVCKLTDFGESRSHLIQTRTLVTSKVKELDRGSPAYMAPEILLPEKRPSFATIEDLKAADLWALGMVFFVLANPSCRYPYSDEIELACMSSMTSRDALEELIRKEHPPSTSQKYERLQACYWDWIQQLHELCTSFDSTVRVRCVDKVVNSIAELSKDTECKVVNLSLSQNSALEKENCRIVNAIVSGESMKAAGQTRISEAEDDGTNACSFLCLKICDAMILQFGANSMKSETETCLASVTLDTIKDYPKLLNDHRDKSLQYTILDAYVIMRDNNHLHSEYTISEELPYPYSVFDNKSRRKLESVLCRQATVIQSME